MDSESTCNYDLKSMQRAHIFPFVQSHAFRTEPFLRESRGYAPFISSTLFSGNEHVVFEALNGLILPDLKKCMRVLTEYRDGQWYLNDRERELSGTGGLLEKGTYRFSISGPNSMTIADYEYSPNFIQPAEKITCEEFGEKLKITWQPSLAADNYWVFVFPENTDNFLRDLIPVTEKMHREAYAEFPKLSIPSGNYRVAIRANQMWEKPPFRGFLAESWSVGKSSFLVS